MRIELNGAPRELPAGATLADAVREAGAGRRTAAASPSPSTARSSPAREWEATPLREGQRVEVLAAIQGGAPELTGATWELGGRQWSSRLIAGTGGFRSLEQMEAALAASGTEIVTVALRRVDPAAEGSVLDVIDRLGLFALPNTAGCLHRPRRGPHRAASPARRSRPTGSSSR